MPFILKLEHLLFILSFTTPLELFTFIGSFIEEVIPPIPSSLVTLSAGGMLATRKSFWVYIIWLALFGAIGKCLGATVLYFISAKAQTTIVTKYGKYLGVTEKQIEAFSKRFGKGWKDDVTLFILRALPIVPSFTVSIGAGILKLNYKTYLIATFFGTIVRDGFFIALGYFGYDTYKKISPWLDQGKTFVLVVLIAVSAFLTFKLLKRRS